MKRLGLAVGKSSWLKFKKFAAIILLFILLLVAGLSIRDFINHKIQNNNQLRNGTNNKPLANGETPPTPPLDELVNSEIQDAHKSAKEGDYNSAASYCDGASSRYFYEKDYPKAKSTLTNCMSLIPKDKTPWFLYKSLGYIEFAQPDKASARQSFSTALEMYKQQTVTQSQDTVNELMDVINQASH